MGRIGRKLLALLGLLGGATNVAHAAPAASHIVLFADLDDDDDSGESDARTELIDGSAARDIEWLEERSKTLGEYLGIDGSSVRKVGDSKRRGAARLGIQGVEPGSAVVRFAKGNIHVDVVELRALDHSGHAVNLAKSHASISRVLPEPLVSGDGQQDRDALRWMAIGPQGALPNELKVVSYGADGRFLDVLDTVALQPVSCPTEIGSGLTCRSTPEIRATSDRVDRLHPAAVARSVHGEVGGRIEIQVAERKVARIRVGGPRRSAVGPIGRYRARIKTYVVRLSAGGAVPVGGTDARAKQLVQDELRTASALWGQCGIHFGLHSAHEIAIVDPPPAHMLAVGCGSGLPASGGALRFAVGKKRFEVPTRAGQTPLRVADEVARTIREAGLKATVSVNPRVAQGALRTADVLVKNPDKTLATLSPVDNAALSSDPSMGACLGVVDFSDGITHFTDFDAVAGTVEERALIKAYDDGDPTTIELYVIPNFARSGRIGESFIYSDGSSVGNAVILDRAGVRSGNRSYTLAHELGHILLDMPGHPDDYGVDQPNMLMDADAADPTIFGPRRISVDECERAIVQSGPAAPVPLLTPWPLFSQEREKRTER